MSFPEIIPSKQAQWATLCPNRSPEFKVHSGKGLASSAVANQKPDAECAIYEHIDGVWTKVWEYIYPDICRCGNEFKYAGRRSYNLDPNHEGSIKDADVICNECYNKQYQIKRDAQELERNRKELARAQAKISEIESRRIARLDLGDLTAKD